MKKLCLGLILLGILSFPLSLFAQGNGEEKSSNDVVTLRFTGWEASPLETKAVKNGIAAFEKAYPKIKVTYTPTVAGDDYNAKLLSSMAGNSAPDVFFCNSSTYRTYVKKGVLLDITKNFSSSFPISDFIDSSRTIMDVDGHIYGISACTVSPIVYYNKDLFDAKGIAYPSADPNNCWTIEEFKEIAKKLTDDKTFGVYGLETVANTFNAQLLSAGGIRFSKDYNTSKINSEATKRVLKTIKSFTDEGLAPSDSTLDAAGMSANQMLQTGKVAMLIDGSWSLQQLLTMGFNIGIAPLPSYGKVLTTGQSHLHCISAKTKHPKEAWEFLTFLSGVNYQGQLSKEGLWLPNRYSFWEEGKQGMDSWYSEDILGPYYREMKDYLIHATVDPTAMQKSSMCNDILTEETDKVLKENKPIEAVLKEWQERDNKAISEQ